jgi:hypothetical protein
MTTPPPSLHKIFARTLNDERPVVGVEDTLTEPGEHPRGDEGDQTGDHPGHNGHHAGPDQ